MTYHTIVIGGGPAGLFAAIHIAKAGNKVLLLEKNDQIGKRFLAAGGGMCNYTRSESIKAFIQGYGDNGKFIRKALYAYNNEQIMDFFKQRGNTPLIREDGKVFSGTERAIDLLSIMIQEAKCYGVDIRCSKTVREIEKQANVFEVSCYGEKQTGQTVILACGGAARKSLGGGFDGLEMAEKLGHTVVTAKPALTPVAIENWQLEMLAGVSFEQIPSTLWRDNKKRKQWIGDVVVTHTGLSGPGILNASRYMQDGDILTLNLIKLSEEQTQACVKNAINQSPKRTLQNAMQNIDVPKRLMQQLLSIEQINPMQPCGSVKKQTQRQLVSALFEFKCKIERVEGLERAMAMAGGVSLQEIDNKTMASKKIDGLYFAGEVMDIDGDTGGYNIQAAFSTGYLAGVSCAAYLAEISA